MYIELEDWEQFYHHRAMTQGWTLSDVGPRGCPEIIIEPLGRSSDIDAVREFMGSYRAGDPHALSAYALIRRENPREFRYWNMESW